MLFHRENKLVLFGTARIKKDLFDPVLVNIYANDCGKILQALKHSITV